MFFFCFLNLQIYSTSFAHQSFLILNIVCFISFHWEFELQIWEYAIVPFCKVNIQFSNALVIREIPSEIPFHLINEINPLNHRLFLGLWTTFFNRTVNLFYILEECNGLPHYECWYHLDRLIICSNIRLGDICVFKNKCFPSNENRWNLNKET